MKRLLLFLMVIGLLKGVLVKADTNLATIQTIQNGFATVKECQKEKDDLCYNESIKKLLGEAMEFATIGKCVAGQEDYKKSGIDVPQCPKNHCDLKGLDNTHPSGGIFALWTGDNNLFLKDLIQNYFKSNSVGKFNLVLPRTRIDSLKHDPKLLSLLNSKRVNIVPVETMPSVDKWMQDSFQFTSIQGKPALYQLEHGLEEGDEMNRRLACKLAKSCDIPYYIPPNMVDPNNSERDNANSGGNLEVLPGGTFLSGIRARKEKGQPGGRTRFQNIQKASLEKSGNTLLEIDVSFLEVGHVDEMFNFVKTDKPAPCDFAVMMASPQKAFELLEKAGGKDIAYINRFLRFFISSAYAGIRLEPTGKPIPGLSLPDDNAKPSCENYTDNMLENIAYGPYGRISERAMQNMKDLKCIEGQPAGSFVQSKEYDILKAQNMNRRDPEGIYPININVNSILEGNKNLIVKELKRSTNCLNPPVIEVPVFFRNGLSYTPNLVNGVVQTTEKGGSNVILPRSYFAPFDEYVEKEMSKYGVQTTFVHDMGYHLKQGEVHCGTNSARVCRP